MSNWPWDPELPAFGIELVGDISQTLKLDLWGSEEQLERFAELLCGGVPASGKISVHVERVDETQSAFVVDRSDCKFKKRVVRAGADVEIRSDMYFLAAPMQNSGLGRRMFRNSLIAYDKLGVGFVTAYANYHNGGYTWAKLGGRSMDADQDRAALLGQWPSVAGREKFSDRDIFALERLLKTAPDESLMYDIACAANQKGQPLGKPLLVSHSWDVFWDLKDQAHRDLIAKALR